MSSTPTQCHQHQHINISTYQHINTVTHINTIINTPTQCHHTSTQVIKRVINTSTHQHQYITQERQHTNFSSLQYQHNINTSTHQFNKSTHPICPPFGAKFVHVRLCNYIRYWRTPLTRLLFLNSHYVHSRARILVRLGVFHHSLSKLAFLWHSVSWFCLAIHSKDVFFARSALDLKLFCWQNQTSAWLISIFGIVLRQ
jgi:hypothetical protein